jgi:hypothetical protein
LVKIKEETFEVDLTIEDYDDFDVELDNETICYGSEYPVKRNLIFTNESNTDLYIRPDVKSNDDLWPDVDSDKIEVEEDESVSVDILFRKQAPVGEYELEIDEELTEKYNSDDSIRFKKTLTVYVENCEITNNSFYINQKTVNMKNNDKATISFDFYNNTDNSTIVNFTGYSDDQSIAVSIPNDTVAVGSQSRHPGSFNVLTSDSTSAGSKTITITATTSYTTISKTITINVTRNNLYVQANSINIPVGLKGIQSISIENNTNNDATVYLSVVPINNNDPIILSDAELKIAANNTKTVYAEIYPRSIGSKSYKLITKVNGIETEKVIYYTSDSEIGAASFVKTYQNKLTSISGVTTSLPVVLENNYNFKTTVTLKVTGDNAITSRQTSVILQPREKKNVNVMYSVNSNSNKTLKAFLQVSSDVSLNEYPLYLTVTPDTSLAEALVLIDAPLNVGFSGESTVKLKVDNPNDFVIKDANITLYDSEDNELGYAKFILLPNETREILVKFTLDSEEDITGSIVLNSYDNSNTYYVIYTKELGYFNNGLFNLGIGGTISIVLGAIIIILLILYFALRRPSVPVIQ